MRSASPPAGTAGRAGIAEASPTGERSARDAALGPAQDGETSTVDQSRGWPFRDTAPGQDPAESRLDPIWGADPPDAVRWQMGMTPDQEPPTSGSPTSQTKTPHDRASAGQGSPSPPAGSSATSPSGDTGSPTSETSAAAGQSATAAELAADASAQASWAAGVDAPTNHGDAAPSNPAATIGLMARRESIGATGGQQVEQAPPEEGGARPSPDWGAGAAGSSIAPSDQSEGAAATGDEPEHSGASERQGPQGERGSEELEFPKPPTEPTGSSLAAVNGTTVGPASGDPAAASVTSGAGDAAPRSDEATAAESAARVPRGTEPDIGWFSAEGNAGQYTGALSEQLSAERPSDEPDRSSGHQASAGGGVGLTSAPGEPRSPEMIESGMVHVDPEPEIGSSPRAAGWTEPPRGHMESEVIDRSQAADRPRAVTQPASEVGEGASSPAGTEDLVGREADETEGPAKAERSEGTEGLEGTQGPGATEDSAGTDGIGATENPVDTEGSAATQEPSAMEKPVRTVGSARAKGLPRTEGPAGTDGPGRTEGVTAGPRG